MRILVVDDGAVVRQLLAAMLARASYEVDVAQDGVTGIEMWEGRSYDFVLMDVQMPRMSGLEATRFIREKEVLRGGHTRIIAITAFTDPEQCYSAGMDAYVSKPINFVQLFALLKGGIR